MSTPLTNPLPKAVLCQWGCAAIVAGCVVPCPAHPYLPVLSLSLKTFLALVASSDE